MLRKHRRGWTSFVPGRPCPVRPRNGRCSDARRYSWDPTLGALGRAHCLSRCNEKRTKRGQCPFFGGTGGPQKEDKETVKRRPEGLRTLPGPRHLKRVINLGMGAIFGHRGPSGSISGKYIQQCSHFTRLRVCPVAPVVFQPFALLQPATLTQPSPVVEYLVDQTIGEHQVILFARKPQKSEREPVRRPPGYGPYTSKRE